jgi:hypothetical protein
MWFGVGGLGVGVWAPIPNPQSPIPNPQSPIPMMKKQFNLRIKIYNKIKILIKN